MLEERYQFFAMTARPNEDAERYIKSHFQDVLGKMYTPYENTNYFSLALDKKDTSNNERLLEELKEHFYVVACDLGENPHDVIANAIVEAPALIKEKPAEKNVLTGLVRRTDGNYKQFMEHQAKTYVMEKIPNNNIMDIRYFLPMVAGAIDGYYEVSRIGFTSIEGNPALRLRLERFIPIGEEKVDIYRSKMQPGELISFDYTMKMYNGNI